VSCCEVVVNQAKYPGALSKTVQGVVAFAGKLGITKSDLRSKLRVHLDALFMAEDKVKDKKDKKEKTDKKEKKDKTKDNKEKDKDGKKRTSTASSSGPPSGKKGRAT
jgi:Mg-chelatase subunit ChlI